MIDDKKYVSSIAIRIAGIDEDVDKVQALASFLGEETDSIEHQYGMVYKSLEDDTEYMVCKGDDEAESEAIKSVESTIEDCGYQCVNGWENFINLDYFDEDRRQYWRDYCYDIKNENDNKFGNRLFQEAYENGILSDDDFELDDNGEIDYTDCLKSEDDVADSLSQYFYEREEPIDFINEMYGNDFKDFPSDAFNLGDCAEYVVREDGRGMQLASYDGHEHEYKYNGEYYYIYRLS